MRHLSHILAALGILAILFVLAFNARVAAEERRLLPREEEAEAAKAFPRLFHDSPVIQHDAIRAILRFHRYHHFTPETASEEERTSCFLYRDGVANQIVRLASGGDIEVRTSAMYLLPKVPVPPEDKIGVLAASLDGESPDVRETAAEALAALGPEAQGTAAKLHEMLDDPDEEIALTAAYALVSIEGYSERVAAMLVEALPFYREKAYESSGATRDRNYRRVYFHVQDAMITIAPEIVPEALALTHSDSPGLRSFALDLLGRAKSPPLAVYERLVECLRDTAEKIRAAARKSLSDLPPSESIIPSLFDTLAATEENSALEYEQFGTIEYLLSSYGELTRPHVVEALSHDDLRVRLLAVNLVPSSGATGVLDKLLPLLNEPMTRERATYVIGTLGEEGAPAANTLIRLYRSEYKASLSDSPAGDDIDEKYRQLRRAEYRVKLLHAIASISPPKKSVPVLRSALSDYHGIEHSNPAINAAWELARFGVRALPILRERFRDSDPSLRAAVARAYGRLARRLRRLERDPDVDAGEYFYEPYPSPEDIEIIRRQAKEAVPGIAELLYSESWSIRRDAVEALSDIGLDAKEALPALIDCANAGWEHDPSHLRPLIRRLDPSVVLPKPE